MPTASADLHVTLPVACAIAYRELTGPDGPSDGDARLTETLDQVAYAIARLAPLHVRDPNTGGHRRIRDSDLYGARIVHGAKVLMLANGCRFTQLTVLREDLRTAIAILAASGVRTFPLGAPSRPTTLLKPGGDGQD